MCNNNLDLVFLKKASNKARRKETEKVVVNLFWFTALIFMGCVAFGYLRTKGWL